MNTPEPPSSQAVPPQDDHHRLLLLSADWQTRALVLAELKERGYGVLALPGFRLGLKALLRGYVDPPLVFVDTKDDPELSPEAIRELRELLPHTPLLLLTGAFQQAEYRAVRDRVDAFLVRPIRVGEIVQAIERWMRRSREATEAPRPDSAGEEAAR